MTKPTPIAPEAADAVRPATPSAAAVMARRRVNQRLFEVYDGEGGGYTRGWTDKRVAEALGVSVGLVAEVREQFHGSLSDSFEARELLARAELIFAEAASIETRASGLSGEIRQLIDTVTLLRADAEAIRRAFS